MAEISEYEGLDTLEQLNFFRNQFYMEGNATERGIIANAINEVLPIIARLHWPHGRLGDLDALEHEFGKLVYQDNWYYNALRHAPTIIPASEEVYASGYDTAGNYHWTGTRTGEHIIPAENGET